MYYICITIFISIHDVSMCTTHVYNAAVPLRKKAPISETCNIPATMSGHDRQELEKSFAIAATEVTLDEARLLLSNVWIKSG